LSRHGFGIVGCGGAAADICAAIERLPVTYVAAVHDRLEERARELASSHGGAVSHATLGDLLRDAAVDVVYVGLPHHLLAPVAADALAAGKHVLVEKPMALDVETVRTLGRLADENGRTIAPVFELRTSGIAREARRLIGAGAIGDVRAVRIRTIIDKPDAYWHSGPRGLVADSWRSRRAEAGGGVVLMNAIHRLDLVRLVTGLSFVRATAETATLSADVEVEDTAAAALRLSNGAIASLVAAAHSPGAVAEERIEIDGAFGSLGLPDQSAAGPPRLRAFLRRPWDRLPAGEWVDVAVDDTDSYLELLRGFVRALDEGSEPPATADDAAKALATVLAIYEAAEIGRVVEIDASPVARITSADAGD
jgi:predicted dehydrogenase